MSGWSYRVVIIVPASSKVAAEHAARAINSTGNDYEGDAVTVALSPDGNSPTTHYGLYTSATDEMVAAMASTLLQIAGVAFWRHDVDGMLLASNVTEPAGQEWGFDQSLAAAGLAVVVASKF